jgi:hypothetical protein
VVKAERNKASATSGHTIFAHGGDTLSPSLMSGIDHGAHVMTLTNLIPPDIFVPGNHEFDFGKPTFLQRMAEATAGLSSRSSSSSSSCSSSTSSLGSRGGVAVPVMVSTCSMRLAHFCSKRL